MKTVLNSKFNWFLALSLSVFITASGQKRTKEFTERFSVNNDVTVAVNTSYTDVEFETWNRNEVEVQAYIEVEGISEEDAKTYFDAWDFEAIGNSTKISITTKSGPDFFAIRREVPVPPQEEMDFDFNFDFEIPEIEEMEPMLMELKEIPPLPPVLLEGLSQVSFDYEAYKEDGEAYLERWKKEFKENFDKNFKEKFNVWQEELKARTEVMEARKEEMEKHREAIKNRYKAAAKERKKALEERKKAMEKMKKEMAAKRKANTFFYRTDSEDRNIKVKKIIKIKMPKDAKLKMNVRHGEVKLAENFKNIKATLSHTRLLADRVDGEHTYIEASYSPVLVERWNKGRLKVNYGKDVAIKNIENVNLLSTSSNIIIGTITGDAVIKGNLGKLEIENITNNFKTLEVILENTDAVIALPKPAFDFYCNTSNSTVNFPKQLYIDVSKNHSGKLVKGYHKQRNSAKNFNLTAIYSDVIIR